MSRQKSIPKVSYTLAKGFIDGVFNNAHGYFSGIIDNQANASIDWIVFHRARVRVCFFLRNLHVLF
jgi:hypothetical protein